MISDNIATPSALRKRRPVKWLVTAGAASLMLHLSALGVLAAWSADRWMRPPRLGASPGVVVFQASFSASEPSVSPVEFTVPRDDVVILPNEATVANQRFVNAPTAHVPLEKFLTREVLDRLLEKSEAVSPLPASDTTKESLALADAPAITAKREAVSRPPSPRRPAVQLEAELQPVVKEAAAESGVRKGPSFAGNRPPSFPADARRNGWQGRVLLRLFISAEGAVKRVEMVNSSGYSILDAEAVATLRTWRGTPATLNGRPVETIELQSVYFGPRQP